MTEIHMIRVSDATYERLRKHVFELRMSYGKVIDVLLDGYDAGDPRTPAERERDAFTAEVLDTQEGDRP